MRGSLLTFSLLALLACKDDSSDSTDTGVPVGLPDDDGDGFDQESERRQRRRGEPRGR